jgi:6-phosphofructokinase 1
MVVWGGTAALLDTRRTAEHYVDEGDRVLLDDTISMVRARGDQPL